jgi:hypothetical protein
LPFTYLVPFATVHAKRHHLQIGNEMVELWPHGEGNDMIDGQFITSARAASHGGRTTPPHLGQSFAGKAAKLVLDPEVPNHGIHGQLRCISLHARECCGSGCTLQRVHSRLLSFEQLSDIPCALKVRICLFEQIARGGCESSFRGLTEEGLLTS